jgi:hypothetical protein
MKEKTEEERIKHEFMKRIKDDQTRCVDMQTGSKSDGLQKYFSNILQHMRERSKQTTTRNGKHSCYNKEF